MSDRKFGIYDHPVRGRRKLGKRKSYWPIFAGGRRAMNMDGRHIATKILALESDLNNKPRVIG